MTITKAAAPTALSVRGLGASFKSSTPSIRSITSGVTALPLGTFALSAVSVANYPILPITLGVTR